MFYRVNLGFVRRFSTFQSFLFQPKITRQLNFCDFAKLNDKLRLDSYPESQVGDNIPPFPSEEFTPLRPDSSFCKEAVSEAEEFCYMSFRECRSRVTSQPSLLNTALSRYVFERRDKTQQSFRYFITRTSEKDRKLAVKQILKSPQAPAKGLLFSFNDFKYSYPGIPNTDGVLAFSNLYPEAFHHMIESFLHRGALCIGSSNTPKFGISAVTTNMPVGWARNPFDPSLATGGSSGGAAGSVAMGIGQLGLASDGAGSIRIPSSMCGTVGLKPSSWYQIFSGSLCGVKFDDFTYASNGFITRTVQDLADVLDITADESNTFLFGDETQTIQTPELQDSPQLKKSLSNLRVAYIRTFPFVTTVNEEVESTIQTAVSNINQQLCFLGMSSVTDITDLPMLEGLEEDPTPHAEWIYKDRIAQAYKWALKTHPKAKFLPRLRKISDNYTPDPKRMAQCKKVRDKTVEVLDTVFQTYDIILMPTLPVAPFELGRNHSPRSINSHDVDFSWNPFTFLFNWTNNSALSLPAGYVESSEGLKVPVGLQIVSCKSYQRDPTLRDIPERLVALNVAQKYHMQDMRNLVSFSALAEASIWGGDEWGRRPYYPKLRYASGNT